MILEVAKQVLLPDPGASVNDVAKAAGVTPQLVRAYFTGRGTAPLYAAIFDEYLSALPDLLGEERLTAQSSPASIRKTTERVVGRYLDWAEQVGQAWVFGESRDRPGTGIAERWNATFEYTADTLIKARGSSENADPVRAAIIAAMSSFNAIAHRMLSGGLERSQAQAVLVETFVALYTTVIPRLESG
ncbi:MAG: TetR/AcrR family transcriptional regulator [Actinomycetes bacterium]